MSREKLQHGQSYSLLVLYNCVLWHLFQKFFLLGVVFLCSYSCFLHVLTCKTQHHFRSPCGGNAGFQPTWNVLLHFWPGTWGMATRSLCTRICLKVHSSLDTLPTPVTGLSATVNLNSGAKRHCASWVLSNCSQDHGAESPSSLLYHHTTEKDCKNKEEKLEYKSTFETEKQQKDYIRKI